MTGQRLERLFLARGDQPVDDEVGRQHVPLFFLFGLGFCRGFFCL